MSHSKFYPNSERLYPLAVEIAEQLSMLNGRNWTAYETPPGKAGYDPQNGRSYLISNDGYKFDLRVEGHSLEFYRDRSRINASPGAQYDAENRYYQHHNRPAPAATVAARRPAAAIAKDINRRVIGPGIIWTDETREFIRQADLRKEQQQEIKKLLVNTFPGATMNGDRRAVHGRSWRAEVGE
ncbi:MAG: hypothetical protein GY943_06120, partial [Chloroflexi bacterium]|nr:hypothetical protein [Chloroflexota bacterium]